MEVGDHVYSCARVGKLDLASTELDPVKKKKLMTFLLGLLDKG